MLNNRAFCLLALWLCFIVQAWAQSVDVDFKIDQTYSVTKKFKDISGDANIISFTDLTRNGLRTSGVTTSPCMTSRLTNDDGRAIKVSEADTTNSRGTLGYVKFQTQVKVPARQAIAVLHTFQVYVNRQVTITDIFDNPKDHSVVELLHFGDHDLTEQIPGFSMSDNGSVSNYYYSVSRIYTRTFSNRDSRTITVKAIYRNPNDEEKVVSAHFGLLTYTKGSSGKGHCLEAAIIHKGSQLVECFDPKLVIKDFKIMHQDKDLPEGYYAFDYLYNDLMTADPSGNRSALSYVGDTCIQIQEKYAQNRGYFDKGFTSMFTKATLTLNVPAHTTFAICYDFRLGDVQSQSYKSTHTSEFFAVGQEPTNYDSLQLLIDWNTDPISYKNLPRSGKMSHARIASSRSGKDWNVDTTRQVITYINESDKDSAITNYFGIFQAIGKTDGLHRQTGKLEILKWYEVANVRNASTKGLNGTSNEHFLTEQNGADLYVTEQKKETSGVRSMTTFEVCNSLDAGASMIYRYSVDLALKNAAKGATIKLYTQDPSIEGVEPDVVLEAGNAGKNSGRRFFSMIFTNDDKDKAATIFRKLYMVTDCPAATGGHQFEASLKFGAIEKNKNTYVLNAGDCYSGNDENFLKNHDIWRDTAFVVADSCNGTAFTMSQPKDFEGKLATYTPFSISVLVPAGQTIYVNHKLCYWVRQFGNIDANKANAVTELFAFGEKDKSDQIKFNLTESKKWSHPIYSFGRTRQFDPGSDTYRSIFIPQAYTNTSNETRVITHYFGLLNVQPGGNNHRLMGGVRLLDNLLYQPGSSYIESLQGLYAPDPDNSDNGRLTNWKEIERSSAVYQDVLYRSNRAFESDFIEHQKGGTRKLYQEFTTACYVPANSVVTSYETMAMLGENRRNNTSHYYGEIFKLDDDGSIAPLDDVNFDEESSRFSSIIHTIGRFSRESNQVGNLPHQQNYFNAFPSFCYINDSDEPRIIRRRFLALMVAPEEPYSFNQFVKDLFGKSEGHMIEWTILQVQNANNITSYTPFQPKTWSALKAGDITAKHTSDLQDAKQGQGYQYVNAPERKDGQVLMDTHKSGKGLYTSTQVSHEVLPHTTDTVYYEFSVTSNGATARLLAFESLNPSDQDLTMEESASAINVSFDYTSLLTTKNYKIRCIYRNESNEAQELTKVIGFFLKNGTAQIEYAGTEIRTSINGLNFSIANTTATLLPATNASGKYTEKQILSLPESINFRGTVYPVTTLGTGSLANLKIKDYSIPAFINTIESGAITGSTLTTLRLPYSKTPLTFNTTITTEQDELYGYKATYKVYSGALGTDCPLLKKLHVAREFKQGNGLADCGPFVNYDRKPCKDWPSFYYIYKSPLDTVFFEYASTIDSIIVHNDTIKNELTQIDSIVTVRDTIQIPDTISYAIGYRAFSGCTNTKFIFPADIHCEKVGIYAFENCDSLLYFDFKRSDIYEGCAFLNANSGPRNVTITPNVKEIQPSALACNIETLTVEEDSLPLKISANDRWSWWGREDKRPDGITYRRMLDSLRCNRELVFPYGCYNPTNGSPFGYCLLEPDRDGSRYQLGGNMHTILEGMFIDNEVEYFKVPDNIDSIKAEAMGMPYLRRLDIGRNLAYIGDHAFMREEMGVNQTYVAEKIKIATKTGALYTIIGNVFGIDFGDQYMDTHDIMSNIWYTFEECNTVLDTIYCEADAHIQATPETNEGCFGDYHYDNTLLIHTSPNLIEKYPWNRFKNHKLLWKMDEYQTEFSCCYEDTDEKSLHMIDCDVQLTDSIKSGWNTFCLPFATSPAELRAMIDASVKIYVMKGLKYDDLTKRFTVEFDPLQENDIMEANKPYMLYTDNAANLFYFSDREVIIDHSMEPEITVHDEKSNASVTMRGNYNSGFAPLQSTILAQNLFHKVDNFTFMRAFHAYFITDDGIETRGATFEARFNADEDDFFDEKETVKENAVYYDLMGRPASKLEEGQLYIHNHQKFIIK